MNEKLLLRATMTVEVEYEVDMDSFDTDDVRKIVQMEQMDFDRDPADLLGRDEAQHWVDVENITGATTITAQQVNDGTWPAGSRGVEPPLGFNIKGTLTGRHSEVAALAAADAVRDAATQRKSAKQEE